MLSVSHDTLVPSSRLNNAKVQSSHHYISTKVVWAIMFILAASNNSYATAQVSDDYHCYDIADSQWSIVEQCDKNVLFVKKITYWFKNGEKVSYESKFEALSSWYSEYLDFESPEDAAKFILEDSEVFPDDFFQVANMIIASEAFDTYFFELLVNLTINKRDYESLDEDTKFAYNEGLQEITEHFSMDIPTFLQVDSQL